MEHTVFFGRLKEEFVPDWAAEFRPSLLLHDQVCKLIQCAGAARYPECVQTGGRPPVCPLPYKKALGYGKQMLEIYFESQKENVRCAEEIKRIIRESGGTRLDAECVKPVIREFGSGTHAGVNSGFSSPRKSLRWKRPLHLSFRKNPTTSSPQSSVQ